MSYNRKTPTPEGTGSLSTQQDEKFTVVHESPLNEHQHNEDITEVNPEEVKRLLRKLDLRVLPIFLLLWFLTFIDRVNIANAKVQGLEKGLRMTGNQYNVALTVFFPTFIVFEVPFNMILGARLKWLPPNVWLSAQILCLSVVTIGQGVIKTYEGLLAMRVLIGVFEANIVPGSILLLSTYYPKYHLQWRLSILMVANVLASAFGGLIAYAIIDMNGKGGYASWRWVFILEGAITAFAALLGFFLIANWPEHSKFLNGSERRLIKQLIKNDCNTPAKMDVLNSDAIKRCLRDWKIWINIVIYACTVSTTYSINLFGPTLIQNLDARYTPKKILLLAAPIFLVAAVFCLASAWISDRLRHRAGIVLTGYLISFIGFAILLTPKGTVPIRIRYVAIYFVNVGTYISLPILWTMLANNVSGVYKTAFASSMQIGFGSVGGIIASSAYRVQDRPLYFTGHLIIFSLLVVAFVLVCGFVVGIYFEKKARREGKRNYRLQDANIDNMGDDHPHFELTY